MFLDKLLGILNISRNYATRVFVKAASRQAYIGSFVAVEMIRPFPPTHVCLDGAPVDRNGFMSTLTLGYSFCEQYDFWRYDSIWCIYIYISVDVRIYIYMLYQYMNMQKYVYIYIYRLIHNYLWIELAVVASKVFVSGRVTFRQALHDRSPSWSHSDLPVVGWFRCCVGYVINSCFWFA